MCVQSESLLWRERDRLEAEKLALQEEREAMEKERRLIMEAARNLDREVWVSGAEERGREGGREGRREGGTGEQCLSYSAEADI